MINKHRLDVFARKKMDPDDNYIGLIPFTWTASSNKYVGWKAPMFIDLQPSDRCMVSVLKQDSAHRVQPIMRSLKCSPNVASRGSCEGSPVNVNRNPCFLR